MTGSVLGLCQQSGKVEFSILQKNTFQLQYNGGP